MPVHALMANDSSCISHTVDYFYTLPSRVQVDHDSPTPVSPQPQGRLHFQDMLWKALIKLYKIHMGFSGIGDDGEARKLREGIAQQGKVRCKIGSDCRHFKPTTHNKRVVDRPSYLDRGARSKRYGYRTSRTPQAEDTPAIWCFRVL